MSQIDSPGDPHQLPNARPENTEYKVLEVADKTKQVNMIFYVQATFKITFCQTRKVR